MRKSFVAFSVTLCIFVLCYFLLWLYVSVFNKNEALAVDGVIDLTAWSFEENGIVSLDGEWEFYPNQLLTSGSEQHAQHRRTTERIDVPGSWSKTMPAIGMATYRLQVNMGETNGLYGIKTATIQLSNRLIVNGNVVGSSGNPAERQHYVASNNPYVSFFSLQPGWNEIILQVANYEFAASSGIMESIYLGKQIQISKLGDRALTHDWITVTAFLIIGLYFIGLFIQRNRDKSLLLFACLCTSIVLYTSTRGERVMLEAFHGMPFWLYYRLQMLGAVSFGISLCAYCYSAFRQFCSSFFVRSCLIAGGCLFIGFLFLAVEESAIVSIGLQQMAVVYIIITLFYTTYVFMLVMIHKVEEGLYLFFASIALGLFALKQHMNIFFGLELYWIIPYEPFVILLMLALSIAQRFSMAYRKIENLSEQLIAADKMKDDFLMQTSHEFKSPIHGVLNISRSMLDEDNESPVEERKEKLELIIGITSRLSQLVYDILDLSKLKQGELRIVLAPTDVFAVVDHQLRIYSFMCKERNIKLINDVPRTLSPVLADESRMNQILGNLLDNAVKYTENGRIIVTAVDQGDGIILISVSDTGEGIEPSDLPHIFEPFHTKDGSENRGFGLGLSISKQLVELHHGQLSVVSTKGIGTTITFTLPISYEQVEEKPLVLSDPDAVKATEFMFTTPLDIGAEGRQNILIVDDEFVNLKILIDILVKLNHRVVAVKNGYEAMEQINGRTKFDLVILDYMMPGMSGYEVCQFIRERYSFLELPILMVTAAFRSADKVTAFQAGANDYLPKPFDPEELKVRISSLLAMKESVNKAIRLEAAFLQSQIKPHFLFNVLNSIAAASYTDAERAQDMIVNLSDYLRGSFRFSNTEGRVSFAEEFEQIQIYIEIERARFKDRIRFETDIDDVAFDLQIPPLLLQPLVENAVRHGIADRIDGGTVQFKVFKADDHWIFIISDNGVGIEPERLARLLDYSIAITTNSVGLLNISKRLMLEYGVQLAVESKAGIGTKVSIAIPEALM